MDFARDSNPAVLRAPSAEGQAQFDGKIAVLKRVMKTSAETSSANIPEKVLAKTYPLRYIAFTLHIRYLDVQVALTI